MRPVTNLLAAVLLLGLAVPGPASALQYRFGAMTHLSTSGCWAGCDSDGQHNVAISGDEALVVWNQCDGRIWFARTERGGAAFTSPLPLCDSLYWALWPRVAVSSFDGVIHVVWEGGFWGQEFQESLYYTRSTDGGRSFEPPRTLGWIGWDTQSNPCLATDGAGNVYIFYSPGFEVVGLMKSSDSGRTFSEPRWIEEVAFHSSEGRIYGTDALEAACTPDGHVVLAYVEATPHYTDGSDWMVVSEDGGETFSQSRFAGYGLHPTLAFAADGRLHMVTASLNWPGIWEVRHRYSDDLVPSFHERRLDRGEFGIGGGIEQNVSVAARDSIVAVAWNRQVDSTLVIAVSLDRGASFGAWSLVTPVRGARYASVSLDDGGRAWVIWMDDRSGLPQVYANRGRLDWRSPARADHFARMTPGTTELVVSPNPAPGACVITCAAPAASNDAPLALEIYDVAGRRVRSLAIVPASAPSPQVRWDGRNGSGQPVGAGLYFLRLRSGDQEQVTRIVLTR
jgi:hypothetical protein